MAIHTRSTKLLCDTGNLRDTDLADLFLSAAEALLKEDTRLETAFRRVSRGAEARGAGGAVDAAYGTVGHGLSYWLYETTLVYLVFRSWIEAGYAVAWDWTGVDLEARARSSVGDVRPERKKRYDLVQFGANRQIKRVFEAKWWNTNDMGRLEGDVQKLSFQSERPTQGAERYLLVFWWGTNFDKDRNTSEELANASRLKVLAHAHFAADVVCHGRRSEGYFAIGLIGLTASP